MTKVHSKFKDVKCNLCGGNEFNLFLKIPVNTSHDKALYSTTSQAVLGEDLIKCKSCRLISVYPMPERKKLISQYHSTVEEKYLREAKARSVTFRRTLKIIKELIIDVNKNETFGKLLDVGAAAGFLLKEAKDAGFDAEGVEPNKFLAGWGQRHLGVKILNKSFEKMRKGKVYDAITLMDVLEHMSRPLEILEKANKILKKGGFLVINYPDIGSLSARIFGRHWWFITSGHLYYFTPTTIKKFLVKSGFKAIEDRPHIQQFSVAYLLLQIGRYNEALARRLFILSKFLLLDRLIIPYIAGQRMVVARKVN